MLGFEDAKHVLFELMEPPPTEVVGIRKALGRVAAEDVRTAFDFPDCRRSAVDGFAVRFGPGASFRTVGVIAAGDETSLQLGPGETAHVMTGGMVPSMADAVVRVEDCLIKGPLVTLSSIPTPGLNINEIGSEAPAGNTIVCKGKKITGTLYPVLFQAGVTEILVYQQPRVAILGTGNEVVEVEAGYERGKVFNTNLYVLQSLLQRAGFLYDSYPTIPDEKGPLQEMLLDLGSSYRLVVSSGGISMGKYDYLKEIFRKPPYVLFIDRTAIRPGSPFMVSRKGSSLFFALPGYPAALTTNALLYLIPALKKAYGYGQFDQRRIKARLAAPMKSKDGVTCFYRASIDLEDGEFVVRSPGTQKTSHFLNFADVNGLVVVEEGRGDLSAGDRAEVILFDLELV